VIAADSTHVGATVTATPGTWSGPARASDTVEVMRCTNTCVPVGAVSGYTISSADVGGVLRLRETASNPGGTTVVWSAQYVGPVTSVSAASAVLGSAQTVLRNSNGDPLAIARIGTVAGVASNFTIRAQLTRRSTVRAVSVHRARGVSGKLRAWVCPVSSRRGAAPPPCTAKVSLAAGTRVIKLPASMGGRLRVVVVRKRH
jgi:hypothetical protein